MIRVQASTTVVNGEGQPVGLRFELFVDDVRASVAFYGATLGLSPPPSWSADGYVPMHAGAVTIGVQHHTTLPADHHFRPDRLAGPRGVGLEIVIEVDDVDRAAARAKASAGAHGGRFEPSANDPGVSRTSASWTRTATTYA